MEPKLINLISTSGQSFQVNRYGYDLFPGIWHFHPEYELTWIVQGQGTRLVGDHNAIFTAGDLVMIGAHTPHTWRSDPDGGAVSTALVLHFRADCLGPGFWELPETATFKKLLDRSRQGLQIPEAVATPIISRLQQLEKSSDSRRLLLFLDILQQLSESPGLEPLASSGFTDALDQDKPDRINVAFAYILSELQGEPRLNAAAAAVHMSPGAFSRYFKTHTRKTFSQFVIELRVGQACKLLVKDEQSINQVCFATGFGNLSHFNKQFRRLKGVSPREFRAKHRL